MGEQSAKAIRKRIETTYHTDNTYTMRMEEGSRVESITKPYVSDDECQRTNDLFRYFGMDSAIAGKPVQSDIDRVAAKAAR
jgi:hypothetical protein